MNTAENRNRIQSVLIRYFQKLDPSIQIKDVEEVDGSLVFFGAINTDIGLIRFGAWLQNAPEQMVFYVYHPIQIVYSARAAVTELITRINYGLSWGCFEMDMDDGELRFRVGLHYEGILIDRALVNNAIHQAFSMLVFYQNAISMLLYDNLSPVKSLDFLESKSAFGDKLKNSVAQKDKLGDGSNKGSKEPERDSHKSSKGD